MPITVRLNKNHIKSNQELLEKYVCNQSSHYENTMVLCVPAIVWNW